MRTMTVEKLLKGMPILQGQIDALLDFEVSRFLPPLIEEHTLCTIHLTDDL